MRNQTYMTRRASATGMTFALNRNTIRHTSRNLGPVSQIVLVCLITLLFGLIYVTESVRATNYDYQISDVNNEISEMEARKEDLAVEKARLTSVAAAKTNTVAAAMEDATITGYAAN